MTDDRPSKSAIAYVAARLPTLSETFVYRELMGLRSRGRVIVPVTVRRPIGPFGDPQLDDLAREAVQVYSAATAGALVPALLSRPGVFLRAIGDAAGADLPGAKARAKFLFQAWMGLAAAWRLRGRGIGHVHAHLANTPATVALYLARGLDAAFSFTGHANDLFVGTERKGALQTQPLGQRSQQGKAGLPAKGLLEIGEHQVGRAVLLLEGWPTQQPGRLRHVSSALPCA